MNCAVVLYEFHTAQLKQCCMRDSYSTVAWLQQLNMSKLHHTSGQAHLALLSHRQNLHGALEKKLGHKRLLP